MRVLAVLALLGACLVPSSVRAMDMALTVTTGNHFTPGDVDPYPVRPLGQDDIQTVVLPLQVPAGNDFMHLNRDVEQHNITALDRDEQNLPLFSGPTLGQNQLARVVTAHLPAGDYSFMCATHNFMQGILSIT